jgi:hypothetical protein
VTFRANISSSCWNQPLRRCTRDSRQPIRRQSPPFAIRSTMLPQRCSVRFARLSRTCGSRARGPTTVQCAPDHRSQRARAGTRAGLRKDRRGAGEARRFFRRSGRTSAARRGRGYSVASRQGGGVLLDDGARVAADVCRKPKPDDITRAFERYRKLNETARNIVAFYERRMVLRANADEKNEDAPRQDTVDNDTIDDDVIFVPSPSTAPL